MKASIKPDLLLKSSEIYDKMDHSAQWELENEYHICLLVGILCLMTLPVFQTIGKNRLIREKLIWIMQDLNPDAFSLTKGIFQKLLFPFALENSKGHFLTKRFNLSVWLSAVFLTCAKQHANEGSCCLYHNFAGLGAPITCYYWCCK